MQVRPSSRIIRCTHVQKTVHALPHASDEKKKKKKSMFFGVACMLREDRVAKDVFL